MYIGSSEGTAFESADLQRIEVLRGLQGTLYGRNATGGAIDIITREVDPSGLRVKQNLNVGNLDLWRSTSLVNVPIKEDVAAISRIPRACHRRWEICELQAEFVDLNVCSDRG